MPVSFPDSPANVIRWLLVALGVGSDPTVQPLGAWPIYQSDEPSSPDSVMTVYDTQGQLDGREMIAGQTLDHFGFQVRFRGPTPIGATDPTWAQADLTRRTFAEVVKGNLVRIGGNAYTVWCVVKIGQVIPLGKENPASRRKLFTLNALASISPNQ
jgi:hypothetical protein